MNLATLSEFCAKMDLKILHGQRFVKDPLQFDEIV